jgi:hypothetical protein
MNTVVYGFQLYPGSDDEFVFADQFDACCAAALEHRAEIKRDEPDLSKDMGATAIYQFEFRALTSADFIAVLNESDSLFRACVIDQRLISLVAD